LCYNRSARITVAHDAETVYPLINTSRLTFCLPEAFLGQFTDDRSETCGRPHGLNTIAASLSEDEGAIEEIYELYLMQPGLLDRTPGSRMTTARPASISACLSISRKIKTSADSPACREVVGKSE
jgi:hypothetical protein